MSCSIVIRSCTRPAGASSSRTAASVALSPLTTAQSAAVWFVKIRAFAASWVVPAAAPTAAITKTSDWGSGYQADVTITNSGASAMTSWKIAVPQPGVE